MTLRFAFVASWLLFAVIISGRSAANIVLRDGVGIFQSVKAVIEPSGLVIFSVHLDDAEVDRVRKACQQ